MKLLRVLLTGGIFIIIGFFFLFNPLSSKAYAATRYWISGTGNWSDTTHWSTSSGGAGGASVPTSSDDVTLDANSGTGNVTIDVNSNAASLSCTGYTGTLTLNSGVSLSVAGSITLAAGMTFSPNAFSTINMTGIGTLTSAGKLFPQTNFTSGTATLGDDLSFVSGNKAIGIKLSGILLDLNGHIISGNSAINRIIVQSSTPGVSKQIKINGGSFANADFQDIQFSNATNLDLSAITGGSGDCGGNSITGGGTVLTFTTSAQQTWQGTAGGNWSDVTKWTSRVPLPQDDVVINSAFSASQTITADMPRLGRSINWTGATGSPTWSFASTANTIYGSVTLISGMTISGTQTLTLAGRSSYSLTSAGKNWTQNITLNAPNGTYSLNDALTASAGVMNLLFTNGSFISNNFNITANTIATAAGTKNITLGTSIISITANGAATLWNFSSSGLTLSAANSTIIFSITSTNTRIFAGAGQTYGTLTYTVAGSTGTLVITGSNTFNTINFSDASNARTLTFTHGTTTTITGAFNVNGTSGKLMTINSDSSGTAFTLSKSSGTVSDDYLSVQDSTAQGGASWYAGSNSTNFSGNTGWTFTSAPPDAPSSLGPTAYVNGSFGTNTQPQLTFTTSDPDSSDTQQYHIQISTAFNFSSTVVDYTSALAAQGSSSFTVGQAVGSGSYTTGSSGQTLADGSYYWRVQGTDNHGVTGSYATANSGAIAFKVDTTAPSGGSITYTDGYYTTTSVALTTSDGTDSGSGIDTTTRTVQRKSATLSAGSCGSYGSFSTITPSGSYPSYTDTTVSSGNCYQYRYQVSDVVGNQATYTSTNTAKVDTAAPSTPGSPSTTTPTSSSSQTWSWSAATDAVSGIANYLWRTTGTTIVSGSTSVTNVVTNLAEGVYTFFVKAVDNAGNQGAESSGTLVVDQTAPVTTDSGTDTSWHNNSVTVTLTCTDSSSGCNHTYYTTDGSTPTTSSTQGTSILLSTEGQYTIKYFSTDLAGNTESVKTAANTVKIDKTAPSIPGTPSTNSPNANTTPTWTWTASIDTGGSGLATNAYTVQWSTDSTFSTGVNSSTSTTNSFTHSTALTNGTWYFRVKATDNAGNTSSYSSNGSVVINTLAPIGSISINAGASYTNTNAVILTLSATDSVDPSSSLQMKLSEDSSFTGLSYQSFATSLSFTLSPGDGSKTVYVRFKDTAGNESTYSASITLDTTGPVAPTLDSPGDSAYTSSDRPTFRWKPTTDATSGIAKYTLEVDNPSIGSSQPSGNFTIDNIPTSGTTDISTNKYLIHFDGFDNSNTDNEHISVYTKSSSDWGSDESDGKLWEGKVSWKVTAVDNAGNITISSRTLLVDRTNPNVAVTQIDDAPITSETNSIATTNQTPTIFGTLTDPLGGADNNGQTTQDDNGPKIASGPKEVDIKIEKQDQGLFDLPTTKLVTLATVNLDTEYFACTGKQISDTSKQTCNKYSPFSFTPTNPLDLGTYTVTLTGKDNAGNSSSETTFTLNITTLGQITSPQEKNIIEQGTKNLPPAQKKEIEKKLVITKPTQKPKPSIVEKSGENILDAGKNALSTTGKFMTRVFTGIGSGIGFVFNGVGSGLSALGNTASNGYDALANNAGGGTKTILIAGRNGVNTVVTQTKDGVAAISFVVGEKTQDVSQNIGNAFFKLGYLFVPGPTKITDVKVAVLSPTTARISWHTNHPATGKVNYGLDETYPFEIQTDKRTNDHVFTVTNLKPNTQYSFEVMSQNQNYVYDANRKFKTPPK